MPPRARQQRAVVCAGACERPADVGCAGGFCLNCCIEQVDPPAPCALAAHVHAREAAVLRRRLAQAEEAVQAAQRAQPCLLSRAEVANRQLLGPQRTIEADADQLIVIDRIPKRFDRLAAESATAVENRDRGHHRQPTSRIGGVFLDGKERRLEHERVERRLGKQNINATIDQG